jgi:hypothetical protein
VLLAFLIGCLPSDELVSPPPWQYADLRLLASPLEGPASHQLVSLYTRQIHSEQQIRLDLLDFDAELNYDLYLALDTTSAGTTNLPINASTDLEWDLLLVIPASGQLQVLDPNYAPLEGLKLRVIRNPSLDMVVISVSAAWLQGPYRLQAFLTPNNSLDVVSSLGPVRSDAWPPPRLPVLLAFWNTFPAYTPAQALRRYDGAHAGPASDRHGLRGLLDAIEATNFPVVLLDIKKTTSLSALDFAGALPRLQNLTARDLIILPDQLPLDTTYDNPYYPPDWVRVQAAEYARQVAQDFTLTPSPFLYSATFPGESIGNLLQQNGTYRLIFSTQNSSTEPAESTAAPMPDGQALPTDSPDSLSPEVTRWGNYTWVNLAPLDEKLQASTQASYRGPTIEIRRSLLEAAASPGEHQFVVLGGDLSQTAWGNPQAATQTLEYLNSRPWIQPVTRAALSTLSVPARHSPAAASASEGSRSPATFVLNNPSGEPLASGLSAQQIQNLLLDGLRSAPDNPATRLAWQAYEALLAPAPLSTPLLAPLRAAYLGQIGHLLAAARWGSTGPQAFCSPAGASASCLAALDLDWDGEDEYILASSSFFGLFEARGGYLALAFVRSSAGLCQIVAPSAQFIVGMGDPLSWQPERGIAGDSSQLRGGFSDLPSGSASPSWETYSIEPDAELLTITSPDGSLRKTFRLTGGDLQVYYTSSQPLTVQIPIAIEPETRFYLGWGSRYQGRYIPGGWSYGLIDGPQVQILTSENLNIRAFSDSLPYMGQPENPDFDYPSGHFLPFPLALVEINTQGDFSVLMTVIIK